MSFFSGNFLIFFIILTLFYSLFNRFFPKKQWIVLLIGSYTFYCCENLNFVYLLVITTLTTWYFSIKMGENEVKNKSYLTVCILINIGILALMKYHGIYFTESSYSIIIPLGISYYTFQSLGYCIDVYRKIAEPEKNFFKYALFVSYFPQITSGPIGRYNDLAPDLYGENSIKFKNVKIGIERIIIGCFKKFVVGNTSALAVNQIYSGSDIYSGSLLLLATFLFGIQLYMDFSGYIDIVLGLSKIFGIKLNENFKTPFFSVSIKDFWRRWHITLGAWFKDYLYYPLLRLEIFSKIKSQKIILLISLFITWFFIGLWHGAAWNFVLFGLFHGFFIMTDVLFDDKYKKIKKYLNLNSSKIWKLFQIFRTYIIVNLGFVLFRANNLNTAVYIYKKIFFQFGTSDFITTVSSFGYHYWKILAISLVFILLTELLEIKKPFVEWLEEKPFYIKWAILYFMITFTLVQFSTQDIASMNFIYKKF